MSIPPSSNTIYRSLKRQINRIRDELFKIPIQDKYNSIVKIISTDKKLDLLLGGYRRELRFLLEATINNFKTHEIDTTELKNLSNNFYQLKTYENDKDSICL